jgi:hypothetical protein
MSRDGVPNVIPMPPRQPEKSRDSALAAGIDRIPATINPTGTPFLENNRCTLRLRIPNLDLAA